MTADANGRIHRRQPNLLDPFGGSLEGHGRDRWRHRGLVQSEADGAAVYGKCRQVGRDARVSTRRRELALEVWEVALFQQSVG